jgi:DNA invertase Pin-like site-specific DNA recombinase
MGKIYGYARCSTNELKQDIERQKRDLRAMGAEEIYWEYESGTKMNRAELAKVLSHIQCGDCLVVTEVSRITRSVKQLCEVLELAKLRRFKLVIGNFVIDCSRDEIDAMTEAMLKMMGVFSELERRMTIDRIKSGLAHAKAKGTQLGRPRASLDNLPPKVVEMWPLYKGGFLSKTDYAKVCGVSRPTIYTYIAMLTDS